jgi:hypothetical protein
MHVERGTLNPVSMDPVHPEITDALITESAGRVRWQIMRRLELVWQTCEPHLVTSVEEHGTPPDPRWAEIGLRALDRQAKLYRLDRPLAAVDPDDEPVSESATRAAILASLEALEQAAQ